MINRLFRKLDSYVHLSQDDQARLADAVGPERAIPARTDIIYEGDDTRAIKVILDGWACRYRQLRDGRRQIVSLLLPGDLCDPHAFLLDKSDHPIHAITPVVLAEFTGTAIEAMVKPKTQLGAAFHREVLATASIQREWTISLGARRGVERLAHLLCELHHRLTVVGLATDTDYALPLTQHDLGHALGQTSVHINRVLQDLRSMGLITLRRRRLTIHDPVALENLARFDPSYMHFTIARKAIRR